MIKSHIIALSLCTAILKSLIFLLFILNTLLHARQRTGKYVIPQDANAPILLRAEKNKQDPSRNQSLAENEAPSGEDDKEGKEDESYVEEMFCAIDANGDGILTRGAIQSTFLGRSQMSP